VHAAVEVIESILTPFIVEVVTVQVVTENPKFVGKITKALMNKSHAEKLCKFFDFNKFEYLNIS
jgi:hypothetical protein